MGSIKSTITRANIKLPIKWAATMLAGSALLSSILGLIRDRQLNGLYYNTYPQGIDAYTVAFLIPDFMFFILVSGALSVSFIPVFNQRIADNNKKSAWELSTSILNLMALATLVTSILIIIFAEPLVRYVVGPGLDESGRALAVSYDASNCDKSIFVFDCGCGYKYSTGCWAFYIFCDGTNCI